MKYINKTKFILSIGNKESLMPLGLSREFTPKEIEANTELQARLANKHIAEWNGTDAVVVQPKKVVDERYEVDHTMEDTKLISVKEQGSDKPVEYVVADATGSDGISMEPGTVVTSFDSQTIKTAADFIESGVDARTFVSGADAIEGELNIESESAEMTDEDTLVENEATRDTPMDADEAIAADAARFIRPSGRNGSTETTVKAMVHKAVQSEMSKVYKEEAKSLDDGESIINADPKVTSFLAQPLNAKKFMIAKETDATFLKSVDGTSQSQMVKQLVKQRLEELK